MTISVVCHFIINVKRFERYFASRIFFYIFAEIVYIMRIDYFDNETLNIGFVMPKFTDCIKVIWYCDVETFYCFILLMFYLLGCFQARFYQYKTPHYGWCETIRGVSFHPIVWNPISVIAEIIFKIMNYFYIKKMICIYVNDCITIDVNQNNQAYITRINLEF